MAFVRSTTTDLPTEKNDMLWTRRDHHNDGCVIRFSLGVFFDEIQQSIERQDESMAQGLHKNEGKLRLDLIPPEAIEGMALVLGKACEPPASKYPERNWEKGLDWMAATTSVERHLLAFKKGQNEDPEFGALHLEHAIARLAMLLALVKRGVGKDDRPVLAVPYEPQPGDWVRIGAKREDGNRSAPEAGALHKVECVTRSVNREWGAWFFSENTARDVGFFADVEKAEVPEVQPGDTWIGCRSGREKKVTAVTADVVTYIASSSGMTVRQSLPVFLEKHYRATPVRSEVSFVTALQAR